MFEDIPYRSKFEHFVSCLRGASRIVQQTERSVIPWGVGHTVNDTGRSQTTSNP